MKTHINKLFLLLAMLAGIYQAAAQSTTAFTYQGQLRDGGTNANGTYTMVFKLYDALTTGNQIGSSITTSPTLANGLFSVNLDFGAGAFNGNGRWLDITVTNSGVSQTLSPRVQILPTPYAQFAAVAASVTNGAIMNAQLAGNAVATTNILNGAITTAQIAAGAVTNANLTANAVATTNIQNNAITTALLATNAVATINIQNGAITDSKIAATTTLMFGSETNLRIVRGIVGFSNGVPVIYVGSGFTATSFAPGSGGTLIGYYDWVYQNGDYYLTQSSGIVGGVNPNDWVLISDGTHEEIVKVQAVDNISGKTIDLETYGSICGSLTPGHAVAVLKNPRMATEWNITFTPPFSGFSTVAISGPGDDAFNSGNLKQVHLNRSTNDAGTKFQAIISYSFSNNNDDGYPGGCPPHGDGFEFIAIGPK